MNVHHNNFNSMNNNHFNYNGLAHNQNTNNLNFNGYQNGQHHHQSVNQNFGQQSYSNWNN
jgi:hypothetical protein